MPIEIRELIIRAKMEGDNNTQPAGLSEEALALILEKFGDQLKDEILRELAQSPQRFLGALQKDLLRDCLAQVRDLLAERAIR